MSVENPHRRTAELRRRLRQTGGRGRKLRGLLELLRPYRRRTILMLISLLLAQRVEMRGRLVEDQDRRVLQEGARDRDALALAAAQRQPALADPRVVALRQPLDEPVRLCAPCRQISA